jgi:signal recognition particle subunit SRP54
MLSLIPPVAFAIDEQWRKKFADVHAAIKPHETWARFHDWSGISNTAKSLNQRLNLMVLKFTKLDGDTRGGAALSISLL